MYRKNKYIIDSLGSLKGLVKGRKENFKIANMQEGFKCGLSIKNNYAKKILKCGQSNWNSYARGFEWAVH